MLRRVRRTVIAVISALLLTAVVLPGSASAQDDEEVVVRIGLHAAEKNLNPFISPRALPITHDFTMLVYDTLFWSQAKLDPEPWLATGAEPSDDFRTWTVSLRQGIQWHDGMPFTAEDVAFTFQYMSDLGGPGRYGHHVTDNPTFVSATVIDPLTVELTFEDPIATFKMLPGGDLPIVAKHIWEGVEDPLLDATSLAVGTGPFRMTEYIPDTSYRLEANADYFKGAPLVDTLIMPVIGDAQAAFAGLQTGELDFVTRNLPAALTDLVNDNPDLKIIEGSRMQSLYLMFNTRKPNLSDPTVRKAMSMAIDVDQIVAIVDGGFGRPGNDTWTHPDSEFAHPTGGHQFDPAAAAIMLDDAGFAANDDGQRVGADGNPLEFTVLVNAAAPPQIRAGELVSEQLEAIGVKVTVEPLDAPAIGAARRPGPDGPPSVDMFIAVFESHAHADPDHLYFFFNTPGQGGVGVVFSGYANAEFDALLQAGLTVPVAEKLDLVNQAQDIFAEEQPAVTLSYPNGRWAYRPAAYDGWIADPGHGVFTKRSFLEEYAAQPAPDDATETEPDDPDAAPEEETNDTTPETSDADEVAADDVGTDDDGGFPVLPAALGAVALGGAVVYSQRRKDTGIVKD